MRKVLLVAAVVIAGLVVLAAQLPARQAFGWLHAALPSLRARHLEGTIWSGRAGQVVWNGYALGALNWVLSPLPLVTGVARMDLTLAGPEVEGRGTVRVNLGGDRITGTGLSLSAPASWLHRILAEPFLQLGGALVADIDTIEFRDGWLTAVDGTTTWQDAVVRGRIVAPLGGLQVDWETVGDRVIGHISDLGGPLSATGQVLIESRVYVVDVSLSAPPEAIAIRQALAVLGRPDESGVVRLRIQGPLLRIGSKAGIGTETGSMVHFSTGTGYAQSI